MPYFIVTVAARLFGYSRIVEPPFVGGQYMRDAKNHPLHLYPSQCPVDVPVDSTVSCANLLLLSPVKVGQLDPLSFCIT